MIPTLDDLSKYCPVRRIIKPGDEIYVHCYDFYVRTRVMEVQYIWAKDGGPGLWHTVHLPTPSCAARDTFFDNGDKTEGEWGSYVDAPDLSGMLVCNQFPWTEFPTGGHAAYMGDEGFFTLEEARRVHGRYRAKKKHRRAKNYLGLMRNYRHDNSYPKRKHFYRRVYV